MGFIILILSCCLLQACTPPVAGVYLRNYSSSPVDLITIFHNKVPDSADRVFLLVQGTGIDRSVPYRFNPANQEKISADAFRISVPSGHSLFFPFNRFVAGGFYDSSTIILVQDHYLIDTLFHNRDMKYLRKFTFVKSLLSPRYFYDHR